MLEDSSNCRLNPVTAGCKSIFAMKKCPAIAISLKTGESGLCPTYKDAGTPVPGMGALVSMFQRILLKTLQSLDVSGNNCRNIQPWTLAAANQGRLGKPVENGVKPLKHGVLGLKPGH